MSRVEPNRNIYVGHRYVPKIMGEWDKKNDYEGLSIVTHQGASYTSKKRVPVGIDIFNDEFWVVTGNYNAQVEQYRQDVQRVKSDMEEVDTRITGEMSNLDKKLSGDMNNLDTRLTDEMSDTRQYVDSEVSKSKKYVDSKVDSKADKEKLMINIKDLGALGDGVNDDTEYFKQAGQMGISVYVPTGEYVLKESVYMESGTHFYGDGYSTKILNPDHTKFVAFRGQGSFSDMYSLSQNAGIGSTSISISNTNDFKPGEYIRIMSQRNAMSREDAGDYWMGVQTSSNDRVFLGEIKRINEVTANQLTFFGGLQFPDYNTHKNDETSANARDNSTIEKVNFKENIKVSDMSFHGGFISPVRFYICANSVMENITWEDARDGELAYFSESYNCKALNCSVEYNTEIRPNNYYSRNSLKTISSYLCGFDHCTVINGTQPVDFTYNGNTSIIDVDSYLTNCTIIGAERHGATAHGGTYRAKFKDNIINDCYVDGIMSRSNQAIITGNVVTGSGDTSGNRTYGIRINQGNSINSIISDNNVSNFDTGIGSIEGENDHFGYMGLSIINNTITSINTAIELRTSPAAPRNTRAYVNILNNKAHSFVGSGGRMIRLYDFIRDVKIKNNMFIGNNSTGGGILTTGNVFDLDIQDNVIRNAGLGIEAGTVNHNIFSSVRQYPLIWDNNDTSTDQNVTGRFRDAIANLTLQRKHQFGSFYPYEDGSSNIGFGDYRWKGIYTMESPNVASDERLKHDIKTLDNVMDIIENLNPVSFVHNHNNEKTYGLIAQEVEKVINDGVVSKNDSNGYYGMKYETLIPFLIKAIQELNDKIK